MPLRTIAARLVDESVKVDNGRAPKILRTLKMVYEGGSLDGKASNFPTRDVSCIVAGVHRGSWHSFETYKRTIWVNRRNGRTIFRCAGVTVKSSESRWWNRLLAVLRLRKPGGIIV
jgi:hypothetical protein